MGTGSGRAGIGLGDGGECVGLGRGRDGMESEWGEGMGRGCGGQFGVWMWIKEHVNEVTE